ncbi:MAG: RsmB/NOP family class I SAM-dependent RNA methyltransferase [Nanoarchaeota archaeon]|nr:RsmB/NOP family class I SAM-dependent RNA methyltransferase [Nanoarchaeota archaeon]
MYEDYSKFLLNRFKKLFKDDFKKVMKVYSTQPRKAIRVNTLKTSVGWCLSRLEKKGFKFSKVPWSGYTFFVEKEPKALSSTTEYLLGFFYILDPTSVLPPIELSPKVGEVVLDMTAAPGGKTTHLSQMMKNKGVIVALEKNKQRIHSLVNNIERMGSENVIVVKLDARNARKLNIKFDKVLLDTPCSSDGTIGKNPELKKRIKKEDYLKFPKMQRSLVRAAHSVLKRGGILLYSTCSTAPEENEEVVEFAVENLGFKLLPLKTKEFLYEGMTEFFGKPHSEYLSRCGRIMPFQYNTQAFFLAKLKKT